MAPLPQGGESEAQSAIAAFHEAGHAVAALTLGLAIDQVWALSEYHPGAVLLGPAVTAEELAVVAAASRPAVLRWLLHAGLANGENMAIIEPGFDHDEADMERELAAAGIVHRPPVRARAAAIIDEHWDDVVEIAQHLCDAGGHLPGTAVALHTLSPDGDRVTVTPPEPFTVAWPTNMLAPATQNELHTALAGVNRASLAAVALRSGFSVTQVWAWAGQDTEYGLTIVRRPDTDRQYVICLMAARPAMLWWLAAIGQATHRNLAAAQSLDSRHDTAIIEELARTGLGADEIAMRAEAASLIREHWDDVVQIAQRLCDAGGDLRDVSLDPTGGKHDRG